MRVEAPLTGRDGEEYLALPEMEMGIPAMLGGAFETATMMVMALVSATIANNTDEMPSQRLIGFIKLPSSLGRLI